MCAQLFYFFQLANRKKFTKDVILRKPRKVQWILQQYDFERRLKKNQGNLNILCIRSFLCCNVFYKSMVI